MVANGLMGGMYSKDELIVDPREAIAALPGWLTSQHGVEFGFVHRILLPANSPAQGPRLQSPFDTEHFIERPGTAAPCDERQQQCGPAQMRGPGIG